MSILCWTSRFAPTRTECVPASTTRSTDNVGYPRKRRQTRRRLLNAGAAVLAEQGPGHMTAGQVAAAAEVAVGTLYNHFPSVDDLIDAVAQDLGRGIEIGRDTLVEIEHDPGRRVAIGVLQLLQMAENDPVSAAAFVSLTAVRPEFRARVRGIVGQAIRDGVEAGRFDVGAGPAATNAVLGANSAIGAFPTAGRKHPRRRDRGRPARDAAARGRRHRHDRRAGAPRRRRLTDSAGSVRPTEPDRISRPARPPAARHARGGPAAPGRRADGYARDCPPCRAPPRS